MNILVDEAKATLVHFDEDFMWVDLTDGRQLGVPLARRRTAPGGGQS